MTDELNDPAEAAIALCKEWATVLNGELAFDAFLFGSTIYDGGDQFDPYSSDLDIVAVTNTELDASQRVAQLIRLQEAKRRLELDLIPRLHRTNCAEPGVSVVAITPYEIKANVHKSGARRFFDKNFFLNLRTSDLRLGLADAGAATIADEVRQALEYVQKTRNAFLGVAANDTGGLKPFTGDDPIPKDLARVAAQLRADAAEGEWYDTRFGLELLFERIRDSEAPDFKALFRKLSKRRGGKGQRKALTAQDQLLLGEILYDLATMAELQPVATWEIRFSGQDIDRLDHETVLSELRRLVPDADVLSIGRGSIVVRLRSSGRSYETVRRLADLKVLAGFFGVGKVEISSLQKAGEPRQFAEQGLIETLAEIIAGWRPGIFERDRDLEDDLDRHLREKLASPTDLGPRMTRAVAIVSKDWRNYADFLVSPATPGSELPVAVELKHIRSPGGFVRSLERLLQFGIPAILVIVGTSRVIGRALSDVPEADLLGGHIRIVAIPTDV